MSKMKIPQEIKAQADKIVDDFNRTILKNYPHCWFSTRYRGQFLYLDHPKTYRTWPVCRLTYTGKMDGWGFAIYKYSNESFDPTEWIFPGAEHIIRNDREHQAIQRYILENPANWDLDRDNPELW